MIIVIGGHGQLGQCLQKVGKSTDTVFLSSKDLDITKAQEIEEYLSKQPSSSIVINCSAYTAVDKAEDEKEAAFQVNHLGVKNLALACEKFKLKLIHISTDYVFDGKSHSHYSESDLPNPQSIYGSSKLAGEKEIETICSSYIIIRTSWLYSEYSSNFVKSILRLAKERDQLGIVADQVGTPTYAIDLAKCILSLTLKFQEGAREVLHFSNEGVASWYDFAYEVVSISKKECSISPIETSDYPTKAERPPFSVLNKKKIKKLYKITIPHWKESLKLCLKNLY